MKSISRHRAENMVVRVADWLPQNEIARGLRSPHFWIVVALMVIDIFIYYVEQTPLFRFPFFNGSFFTGVHDIQRTLFLLPLIYAALVFRVRGSLISSFVFFLTVLPRALLFSPYPEPLLRPLFFVGAAGVISLLIAIQLNRLEAERNARKELNSAYQELSEYDRRLKENQEKLIQTEKLTSLGQIAASIAHEINNPLSGVLVYTRLLAKKIKNDEFSKETALEYLSKMELGVQRSTRLIQNLLDFARQSLPTLSQVNVNEVIGNALEQATQLSDFKNIKVTKDFEPALPVIVGDFNQLQRVCANLILNAAEAMPEGGMLTLRTMADDSLLKIEVRDTGHGISPENMRKLFTPFFTTKGEVKGVGLGLAVAYGIVQSHRGKIEVQSKEGEDTTFTIELPLCREEDEEKG